MESFLAFLLVLVVSVQGEETNGAEVFRPFPSLRQNPSCGANLNLTSGTSSPLISADFPGNYPSYHYCSWKFACPEDITLQCSSFQLPVTLLCLQSAFIYNNKWQCGTSTQLQTKVNVGKTLSAILFSVGRSGPGFKCTVACGPQPPPCNCGVSRSGSGGGRRSELSKRSEPASGIDRIIGGTPVPSQLKYPWMAWMVNASGQFTCGGSLINDRYVLTAAHCVSSNPSGTYMVTLGDLDRSTSSESRSIQIAATAIMHPGFDAPTSLNNDIALLKLATPVDFSANPNIRPICVSSAAVPNPGDTVTIAGWGRVAEQQDPVSSVLLETNATVIASKTCQNWFGNDANDNFFCAQNAGKNICNGDAGGPVMFRTTNGTVLNVGINSFVIKGCFTQFGGAYIKTANYVDSFIKSNTADALWCPAA